ncbi:MAG: TonB-dependent receptor [Flavobacteriia bacterium]|nr:TonB-dependent receptor [Flavobacteriia bacterium]
MKPHFIIVLFLAALSQSLSAQNNTKTKQDSTQQLKEVVVSAHQLFGSKFKAKNRTGAAYYMDSKELQKFNITDVNRALKAVPGVSIYEEDGMGLRPNISLRGSSPERSAKLTLMEDGVLIAPAPYSAAAAYYFPTIARMQAVEILKGSSQIQYGPYTTGGAINMVSSQIPSESQTSLLAQYGSYNSELYRVLHGNTKGKLGYVLDYTRYGSNGFKELPSGANTGFEKQDFVGKLSYDFSAFGVSQTIQAKYQYSDETSNETYVGLTDADFKANPFQRYAGSEKDQMNTLHRQYMITHSFNFSPYLSLTTTAYQNEFGRNWYKLNDVGTTNGKFSLGGIFTDPISYADELAVIKGTSSQSDALLYVKANNREYLSKGVQTKLDIHWSTGQSFHDLELGARWHYDEEDRFQWVDQYQYSNGSMMLQQEGVPGTDANRISSAEAFSTYALYKLTYKNLTVSPGIRYENMDLARADYGKSDLSRSGSDLSERSNSLDVVIPGIGFQYKLNQASIFGGIHKGFAPPGSVAGQKAEESINTELGIRFSYAGMAGEIVGYRNDYSNLLGSDFAATGGTGNLDLFNAGEVLVQGIELLLNYDLMQNKAGQHMPLSFGYTLTDSEFQNNFDANDGLWGSVARGDEMPYIARHQWHVGLGYEKGKWAFNSQLRYMGDIRTQAGQGSIPNAFKINSNTVLDASVQYQLNARLRLQTNIINGLDATYASSRVPYGLRPGHPFGINMGIRYGF